MNYRWDLYNFLKLVVNKLNYAYVRRYYLDACEKNSQLYAEKQHIESSEQIRLLSGVSSSATNHVSHL